MFVVTVTFIIKPGHINEFLPLMRENADLSLSEEDGCSQFDVCQSNASSDEIFLYEIYDDEAAFNTHLAMPHYISFSEKVGHMVSDKMIKTYSLGT